MNGPDPAELQERLGHAFRDPALLRTALTHRSYVNEAAGEAAHNERLEFLGDAVLGLAVATMLMELCPGHDEGELSALRARVVNERALAGVAGEIGLGQWLLLGRGEDLSGGRTKPSLLADACEAVLGAVYLDAGWDAALAVARRLFSEVVLHVATSVEQDHKSMLQEWVQARHRGLRPQYTVLAEEGPSHDRTFEVAVWLDGRRLATGRGKSKREAGQEAAALSLDLLKAEDVDPVGST